MNPPRPIGPFAVEDTTVQIAWRPGALLPGFHRLGVGPMEVSIEVPDYSLRVDDAAARPGGGVALIEGLRAGTRYPVLLGGRAVGAVTTLRPPPGDLLARFATISDLHIGEHHVGPLGRITEGRLRSADERGDGGVPYAVRALRSALADMRAWGAEALVVKGDITHRGRAGEIEVAGRMLTGAGIPVIATNGNHEVKVVPNIVVGGLDTWGIPLSEGDAVVHHDLPGIRLVTADTTRDGRHAGELSPLAVDAVRDLLADAPAAFIGLHHHLHRHRMQRFWPPGIDGDAAADLVRVIRLANPKTLVSSGHTHRNRRHLIDGIVATEVGSTKDYPGVWAGYAVHEGGIRQMVRRVSSPDVIPWIDRTAEAAFGAWRLWAPGHLTDRCFTHPWPT